MPSQVVEAKFLGNIAPVHVMLEDGTRVRIQVEPGRAPEIGRRVRVRFDGRQSSVFS